MNITASINEAGDLLIEGYDSGPLVKELKGDLDYEYKMAITKSQKENLIKKLAQELQQDLEDEN